HEVEVAGREHRPIDQPHVLKPEPRPAPAAEIRVIRLADSEYRAVELNGLRSAATRGVHETLEDVAARDVLRVRGRRSHEDVAAVPELVPPAFVLSPRLGRVGRLDGGDARVERAAPRVDGHGVEREGIEGQAMVS